MCFLTNSLTEASDMFIRKPQRRTARGVRLSARRRSNALAGSKWTDEEGHAITVLLDRRRPVALAPTESV
jgi:hypothetical protein